MEESNFIKKKIRILFIFFTFFSIALLGSSFRWTIVEGGNLRNIADGRVISSELTSLRGSIYARDGSILAFSEPRFNMYIWTGEGGLEFIEKEIKSQTRDELLEKISPIIDKTPEELGKTIKTLNEQGINWIPVAKNLNPDKWEALNNLKTDINNERKLAGFTFEYTSERIYPEKELASHLIGLTTRDDKGVEYGISGLEFAWNGDLNPRKGITQREQNATGETLANALIQTIEPKMGSSIHTSIDKRLQLIADEKTKWAYEFFDADNTSILISDPKTGEILAMSNYPTYDPNKRSEIKELNVFGNTAISAPYEIGSVAKSFALASAIDSGKVSIEDIILPNGHNGCEKIVEDEPALCTFDSKPQPPMPLKECFWRSDNICFFHLSKLIGTSKDELTGKEIYSSKIYHDYLLKFGVGISSGIDIGGESTGLALKDIGTWNLGDVAAFSYGHGFQMNTVQVLSAISVFANDGVRMRPFLVKKIIKGDGIERHQEPLPVERVISLETANEVQKMMKLVFDKDMREYETQYYDLKNYNVGYKSGTALIAEKGVYTDDIFATHAGCDFSPDKKFCMVVKLEKPRAVERLSFYNSRVMFLETLNAIKDYLNLERIK